MADDDRRQRLPQPDPRPPGSDDASWASSPARAGRRPGRAAATLRDAWASLLATLPPAQRIAIVLRHVDGLSYAEMAEALGRPEGTLKAQVHRGLATLRDALADERHDREEMTA